MREFCADWQKSGSTQLSVWKQPAICVPLDSKDRNVTGQVSLKVAERFLGVYPARFFFKVMGNRRLLSEFG
jgi:hypothetical protein